MSPAASSRSSRAACAIRCTSRTVSGRIVTVPESPLSPAGTVTSCSSALPASSSSAVSDMVKTSREGHVRRWDLAATTAGTGAIAVEYPDGESLEVQVLHHELVLRQCVLPVLKLHST